MALVSVAQASACGSWSLQGLKSTGCIGYGKNDWFCHSERSEESLFDLGIREQIKRDASLCLE
jgi:hypothetical protein